MSACEYAAPTTRLDSRVVFLEPLVGVALRQNCAVELHVISISSYVTQFDGRLKNLLGSVCEQPKGQTQLARRSKIKCAVQFLPTWTISCYSGSASQNNKTETLWKHRQERLTCGGGFLPPLPEEPNIVEKRS